MTCDRRPAAGSPLQHCDDETQPQVSAGPCPGRLSRSVCRRRSKSPAWSFLPKPLSESVLLSPGKVFQGLLAIRSHHHFCPEDTHLGRSPASVSACRLFGGLRESGRFQLPPHPGRASSSAPCLRTRSTSDILEHAPKARRATALGDVSTRQSACGDCTMLSPLRCGRGQRSAEREPVGSGRRRRHVGPAGVRNLGRVHALRRRVMPGRQVCGSREGARAG